MLKANFNITETGGTGVVQLQSSSDQGATWQNLSTPLTLSQGALTVDDSANILIDTSVFLPGQAYSFRLTDTAGLSVSNVQVYTIHDILGYTAGTGTIGFANVGGVDSWEIDFYALPGTTQVPAGVTLDSYDYDVTFWAAQVPTAIGTGNQTADHTVTAVGYGAGVYVAQCGYRFSDMSQFTLARVVKVDAAGTILIDIQINGCVVSAQSGMQLTEQADVVQTGANYNVMFVAIDTNAVNASGTLLATTNPATFTIPADTTIICILVDFDSAITADFNHDFFPYHSITTA